MTEVDTRRCAHCGVPLVSSDLLGFPSRRGDASARGPLVGRVLDGKYRMLSVLGRGGMGTVYRAQHEVSHAPVAVKVLNPRFAARGEFRRWFLGEARRAGRVIHENSARVQDVGEAPDGTVYLAVELVEGRTLREWMDSAARLSPRWVVDVLIQITRALGAAHDAGVVHRDLSPRNVLVADSEGQPRVKILDFGIAAGAPGQESVRASAEDPDGPRAFANPPYSAPEHLNGKAVDGRADLYSLGAVAFEALTGEFPVEGRDAKELATATRQGQLRRTPRVAGVPRSFRRLIDELLEPDPADRPPDAHLVAERLTRIRAGQGRTLSTLSLAVAVVATAFFAWAYAPQRQDVYLFGLPVPGALRVVSQPPQGNDATQVLRTEDLLKSRFEMRGLRVSQLGLRILRHGSERDRIELRGLLRESNGVVQFLPEASAELQVLLSRASQEGPVDLVFTRGDQQPVAYARCRLDDDAPELEASLDGPEAPAALQGESLVSVEVQDAVGLEDVALVLEVVGATGAEQIVRTTLPGFEKGSSVFRQKIALRNILGDAFDPFEEVGMVRLRVDALDLARHRISVELSEGQIFDPGAPGVVRIGGLGDEPLVIERAGIAEAWIELEAMESELTVECRGPGMRDWRRCDVLGVRDARVSVALPAPDAGGRPLGGVWWFRVVDVAGNVGAARSASLEVRSAAPTPALRVAAAGSPHVARVDDSFYSDGRPCPLEFTCNSLYRPVRVRIRGLGGEEVHVAGLEDAQAGRATVDLPALEDGRYAIEVQLEGVREKTLPAGAPYPLLVRSEAPRLELPRGPGRRDFLPELVDLGLFRIEGGRLNQGLAWQVGPEEPGLLRGTVLVGANDSWSSFDYRPVADGRPVLLPPLALGRGEVTVAVAMQDVLGRPLQVWADGRRLPETLVDDRSEGVVVARFLAHDAPFEPADAVSLVEFGQPVSVAIRSAVPLGERAGEFLLATSGNSLAPEETVGTESPGGVLRYRIPFAQAVLGTDLEGVSEQDFEGGLAARLRVNLRCPLGTFPLSLELRSIRTTLLPVHLGELGDAVPESCAAIRMVPVTGPGRTLPFADPVPADAPLRASYRASPALTVRNLGDFLLQDRELSEGEYLALVSAGVERWSAAEDRDELVAALVHGFDPLGAGRLSLEAMRPARYPSVADWQRAAGTGRVDAARPLSGIDGFQAETVARLAGFVVARDPSLFRLPFGVELEIAATGPSASAPPQDVSGSIAGPAFRAWSGRLGSPEWPPLESEARALGDVVTTPLGHEILGLHAGVREWVADLPFLAGDLDGEALLREWMSDHVRHQQRVEELFARRGSLVPRDLLGRLATFGVLRGIGTGEPRAFVPVGGGRMLLPGVVRTLQVRRDGQGFPSGSRDPHVARAGMRLAGGDRLVEVLRK